MAERVLIIAAHPDDELLGCGGTAALHAEAGDTVTSVGGQTVSSASDIQQGLVKYHPGDKISISWLDQSGQSQTATVTLANGPAA